MAFEFTPLVLVCFLTVALALPIAIVAWQRRKMPGGVALALIMLALAEWALGAGFELASVGIPAKVFWSKIEYLGTLSAPVFFFIFALDYNRMDRWVTRPKLVLYFLVPLFTFGLAVTNEWHGCIWSGFTPSPTGDNLLIYSHGPCFWIGVTGYLYLAILAGVFLLLWAAFRFPRPYRRQTTTLLAGIAVPWIGNLIYVLGFSPEPGLEITPLLGVITGGFFAVALFRLQLFDLAPVAREAIIESMQDAVVVLDPQDRVVDLNPAAERITGKTAMEAMGRPAAQVFSQCSDWADKYAHWSGSPSEVILPCGTENHQFDLRLSPLTDRHHQPVGQMMILHDVTENRRAEEAVRQSEKKYRLLVNTLQEGIWVIDQASNTTFVNPRMAEMLGYSVEEMQGRHLFSFMDESGVELAKQTLTRRQQGIHEHFDFEFIRKDKSRIYVTLETGPITDEHGNYAGAIAGVTDITERRRAEETLRASEQYSKSIVDSSLDLIITTDQDRRIVEFNRAAQLAFGYAREEVLGQNVRMLYADSQEGQTVHETVLHEGHTVREIWNKRKNGETFPCLLSAAVLRDDQGAVIGMVGVSRDITERRSLDERLHRQLDELGALHQIAVISVEARDQDTLIEQATQVIGNKLFPDNFGVLLLDDPTRMLQLHPSYRVQGQFRRKAMGWGQGITGQVAATGRPYRSGDVTRDPLYVAFDPQVRSELCAPLKVGERILGVINAESTRLDAFTEADEQLVVTFAGQLATAIDRLRTEAELTRMATTDSLTGVMNRRFFFELADRELKRCRRSATPLSAIMLDIDHFKAVNDTYGHGVGDEVLRTLTQNCLRQIRETDLLGRYGGEEFAVLLPDTDLQRAEGVAERVRKCIAQQPVATPKGEVRITISAGVVQATEETGTIATLLDRADAAMYVAKKAGRNLVASDMPDGVPG